jgi:multidrug efflux pump subunit AcrA (membrane-fusion protein)
MVMEVNAREGRPVEAGAILATLRNLPLQSDFEYAKSSVALASQRAAAASLQYAALGSALKEQERSGAHLQQTAARDAALAIRSPIDGTVITPRVQDLVGSYMSEGQHMITVADLSSLRARIYVSEYDLYRMRTSVRARIQVQGQFRTWPAKVTAMGARPVELDANLSGQANLKGMSPPHFYLVDLLIGNHDGRLKPGMTGVARIYGRRRSLLGMAWEGVENFWERKIW